MQIRLPDTSPATSSWTMRLQLVATLRNGDVSKANGPPRLAYRQRHPGQPRAPVDNQSRFGVTSAFLRANSPAFRLHLQSAAQKETEHRPRRRSDGAASIKPTRCKALAACTVPCHACLHEITFRLPSARAAICIGCRQDANYCAVLTLESSCACSPRSLA